MNPVYVRLMAQRKVANMPRLNAIENQQVINAATQYSRHRWGKAMVIKVEPTPFGFAVVFASPLDPNKKIEEKKYHSVDEAQQDLNPPAKQLGLFGR
jgi:hypothetical protein